MNILTKKGHKPQTIMAHVILVSTSPSSAVSSVSSRRSMVGVD